MKHSLPEIRIGLDPGSSLTKVVYALDKQSKSICMKPQVLALHVNPADSGLVQFCASPERQAWLQLPHDDKFYAVGQLAQQCNAIARLDQLKYEQALYKILAAIGAIIQREQVSGRFTVKLATVLPYGEYLNGEQLKQNLTTALKNFEFRGQKMKGTLDTFFCMPEGGGHVWELIQKQSQAWFQERVVVVLMLGHRDISCLTFSEGSVNPQHSQTAPLGFTKMLRHIIQHTAGLDETIAPLIFDIGQNYQPDNRLIRALVRSSQPSNMEREAQAIGEAIRIARLEYTTLVKNWLDQTLPRSLETLIVGGGASFYLKEELTQILSWAAPIWSEPAALAGTQEKKHLLNYRMADIAYLFDKFLKPSPLVL
jgi:hypothetical protein